LVRQRPMAAWARVPLALHALRVPRTDPSNKPKLIDLAHFDSFNQPVPLHARKFHGGKSVCANGIVVIRSRSLFGSTLPAAWNIISILRTARMSAGGPLSPCEAAKTGKHRSAPRMMQNGRFMWMHREVLVCQRDWEPSFNFSTGAPRAPD